MKSRVREHENVNYKSDVWCELLWQLAREVLWQLAREVLWQLARELLW